MQAISSVTHEAVNDADSCDCNRCTIGRNTSSPFQPKESEILSQFQRGNRHFLAAWYDQFNWVTLCINSSKVFCACYKYAMEHKLIPFSKQSDSVFLSTGFDTCNYKKAVEKFNKHASSLVYHETVMKCSTLSQLSILSCLSSRLSEEQELH